MEVVAEQVRPPKARNGVVHRARHLGRLGYAEPEGHTGRRSLEEVLR